MKNTQEITHYSPVHRKYFIPETPDGARELITAMAEIAGWVYPVRGSCFSGAMTIPFHLHHLYRCASKPELGDWVYRRFNKAPKITCNIHGLHDLINSAEANGYMLVNRGWMYRVVPEMRQYAGLKRDTYTKVSYEEAIQRELERNPFRHLRLVKSDIARISVAATGKGNTEKYTDCIDVFIVRPVHRNAPGLDLVPHREQSEKFTMRASPKTIIDISDTVLVSSQYTNHFIEWNQLAGLDYHIKDYGLDAKARLVELTFTVDIQGRNAQRKEGKKGAIDEQSALDMDVLRRYLIEQLVGEKKSLADVFTKDLAGTYAEYLDRVVKKHLDLKAMNQQRHLRDFSLVSQQLPVNGIQ